VLCNATKAAEQGHDVGFRVIRQTINHPLAFTLRGYKAGAAQLLQVLRSVCHSEAHPLGERFDTSRALRQLLDQLNPMFVAHCLRHLGKRGSNRSGSRAA
jgi:hypothetical protein